MINVQELDKVRSDARELINYLGNDGEVHENEYINMYINAPEFKKLVDNAIQGIESEKAFELCVCACCARVKGTISKEEFYDIVDGSYDADGDWKNDYIETASK